MRLTTLSQYQQQIESQNSGILLKYAPNDTRYTERHKDMNIKTDHLLSNISGFPEFLPKEQIAFNKVIKIIKSQFELHGFIPLETPAVERTPTLLAKGNDNEIYGLYRLADDAEIKEKDIALRFDLTIPLARYVAQHYGNLTFPYRRYQIAPVWRGERPQAGRYRQFYQCDVDIIGDGELSLIYDAEALSVVYNIFKNIGLKNFEIKINNRSILTGLLKSFGVLENNISHVMRTIDKAAKISKDEFRIELSSYGLTQPDIEILCGLIIKHLTNVAWLEYLPSICTNPEFLSAITELKELIKLLHTFEVLDQYIQIDPTLARGLNYYTSTVSEIQLLDYPELGSVCGGGRYANLASSFSKKPLPGVGFSIGISRLIPKLIESGIINANQETPAIVLVTVQNTELMPYYIKIAKNLRANNINTEIYLANKTLGAQMKYASKKGFKFVIIANEAEFENQKLILRSLSDGRQESLSIGETIEKIVRCKCLDNSWI